MKKLIVLFLIIFHIVIAYSRNKTNNNSLNSTTLKNESINKDIKIKNQTETNNQNKEQNKKLNKQINQKQNNQTNINNSLNTNQIQSNKNIKNDSNQNENELTMNLTQALKDFAKILLNDLSNSTNEEKEKEKEIQEKKLKEEIKKNAEKIRMKKKEIEMNKTKEEIKLQREECENRLSNIVFNEFLSISIPGKSIETLYQNITNFSKLTLSFYISDEQKQIHFTFSGPNKKGQTNLIKTFRKRNCLYFEYDIKIFGQYSFILNNYQNSENTELLFLMHLTNLKSDKLGSEKIDKISGYLQEIDQNINNMIMKQGIINKKTNAHNDSVNKHNKQILIYSIVEVIVLLLVFFVQGFYVKKLVNKL